jgi:hypothetical protein
MARASNPRARASRASATSSQAPVGNERRREQQVGTRADAEYTAERNAEPNCESDDEREEVAKEDWVNEEEDVEFEDPESVEEEDEDEDEPRGGRRRAPLSRPSSPRIRSLSLRPHNACHR